MLLPEPTDGVADVAQRVCYIHSINVYCGKQTAVYPSGSAQIPLDNDQFQTPDLRKLEPHIRAYPDRVGWFPAGVLALRGSVPRETRDQGM